MKEQLKTDSTLTLQAEKGSGHVLVFHDPKSYGAEQIRSLKERVSSAEIEEVHSLREYRNALAAKDFDVVVLDYDIPGVPSRELLMQLQLRDHEPEVILVSSCENPQTVKSIAAARKRYVVRDSQVGEEVSCAIRDMLRIRKLEEEMAFIRARLTEANRKLEEKNRRLDEFCATVAHDIRGPLAGLMLKIEYILSILPASLDSRCSAMLKRSYDSAQRLIGMVHAMYEYARAGLGAVTFEHVALAPLVADLVDDLGVDDGIEESKDIQVGIGQLETVWGGRELLKRVFINLIGNAIKYNDKSSVVINIGSLGIEDRGCGAYASVFVDDNGPGIPEPERPRLFDMFTRGKTASSSVDGLGVGLAVVRRIVEMHHGEITLEQSPLGGCRFVITLPVDALPV